MIHLGGATARKIAGRTESSVARRNVRARRSACDAEAGIIGHRVISNLAGVYAGTLDDAGETITLAGPQGQPIFEVTYDAAWYPMTDGAGFSLVLADESGAGRLNAVAFGVVGSPLGEWLMGQKRLHLLGELKRNSWQGRDSAQFIIADAARV